MSDVLVEYWNSDGVALGVTPFAYDVTRTWLLNDIGTAAMTFAAGTPYLRDIVQWGNILFIYEVGIPVWVGTIEQREWDQGNVTLQLKSAETLLQKHLTRAGLVLGTGVTPENAGQISYALFQSAVVKNDPRSLLKAGDFSAAQTHAGMKYDYKDLFDAYRELADLDKSDFWVDTELKVNFTTHRGTDRSNEVVLYEGTHLISPKLVEGPASDVLTHAIGISKDSTFKLPRYIPNQYFHKAEVLDFSDVTDLETLAQKTTEALQKRAMPTLQVDCTIADVRTTWQQFQIGDLVRLVLFSTLDPMDVVARVTGQELGPTDEMRCVFEIVSEYSNAAPQEWVMG